MQGFSAATLGNGVRYVAIHYTADEDKRGEWAAKVSAGVPDREWKREMELHEDIYDGQPVYADYRDSWHSRSGLGIVLGSKHLGGWDCGATLVPAHVHLQITPAGQVQALLEEVSDGDDSMETFAPKVNAALLGYGLGPLLRDIDHQADATVNQRSGTRSETAKTVAAEHGFALTASSNVWAPRVSAVTWLLTDRLPSGEPRFVIDPDRCPVLRAGFLGAYKFEESPRGDTVGPGRILTTPLKNSYSHVHDALQYAAMKARAILDPKKGERRLPGRRGSYV